MEPELAPVAAEVAPAAPQEALEHAVEIIDGEHTKYPAALASHERVLEDKELFLALLQDLCTKLQDAEPKQWRPTKFRVPTAAGQDLDLQRLYRLTTELGGAVEVTDQARWPDVIKPMNFPSKVNTAAIRKIYSQLLWHFEQVYFNGAAGQPLDEPPEFAAATAAAAAVAGAGSADRGGSAAANGGGRARPARSRKGPSLAALLAAEDQISSGLEEAVMDDYGSQGSGDRGGAGVGSGDEGDDPAAAAAEPVARKPMPAALLSAAAAGAAPGSTASPSRGSAPPQQAAAAAANGVAPPPAAPVTKPRSRPSQPRQQGRSGGLVPGRTPELTAFHKQGRHRRDLTGATVTGKVEARFDCGYFVSITVGGMQFGGVLYCPAGTGTAAPGAGGAQGGQQQASRGANRQDSGAGGGGDGSSRRPPAGSSVKREAGTAGLEEGGGTGGSRPAAKRRRSYRDPNDPTLANKPKSAKTAFNFFAAEQWASLRGELGANAAPQDISRLIGERWNKATEEERAPYVVQAQQDKTRYEREMETWRSELDATAATAAADGAAAADTAAADADAAAAAAGGVGSPDAMDVDPATVAAVAAAVVKAEQRSATPPRPHHPKIKLKMHGPGAGRGTPPPAAAPGGYAGAAEHGFPPPQLHTGGELGSGGGAAVSPTLPAAEPYLPHVSLPAAAAAAAPASPVLGGAAGGAADGLAMDVHAPSGMHAAGPGGDMQL